MDRIREARRGTMTAVNGGLSKRRQRSSNLRDSPEEDGAMEMQETSRLRDRGSKKDRDRDRSSRSKRRRGDRLLHGSHREDGDESSEESVDEEEDDDEDDSSVSMRLPHPPVPNPPSQSASLMQSHHIRKGYAAKPVKPPGTGTWKVVEEMIGAPIPRKARSSSVKRSQECWVSCGGGGACGGAVGGEQPHWQTSTSPARPGLSSTTPVSPPSSNASIRKKMKAISGTKHRPPKISKSSSIQEIEIEVAEVLFGMTRQVPLKKENHKNDSKESNEAKPWVSSPIPISSPSPTSQSPTVAISNPSFNRNTLTAAAPKRKRPRIRFEVESPTSTPSSAALPATPNSSVAKLDKEALQQSPAGTKTDPTSPKSEKNIAAPTVENGVVLCDPDASNVCSITSTLANSQQDSFKPEGNAAPDPKDTESQPEKKAKEEAVSPPKESPSSNLDVNIEDTPANKAALVSDNPREEKFNLDMMESTLYCVAEHKSAEMGMGMGMGMEMEREQKLEVLKGQKEMEKKSRTKPEEIVQDCRNTDDSKKQAGTERNLDLQLDLEKQDKDFAGTGAGAGKHHAQKHQPRGARAEPRTEKAGPAESLPLPIQIPGWPGGFPPFGYMAQVPLPPFGPVDASTSSSKAVQGLFPSQLRPKRCATHCYIAQNIHYHQQMTRLHPYWSSAVGAAPFYASKQYNLSTASLSDSAILSNPMQQGNFPGQSPGSVQEKEGPIFSANSGLSAKEKNNTANPSADSSQKKQPILQQSSQPGSAGNMLAPAFIFPLNQQQAATVGVCAANRSAAGKLTAGSGNAFQSSSGTGSATLGTPGAYGPGTSMSFSYPGLPANEAQYLAFLQNNAYPFPIPAHVAGAPPYRGATPAQAMPFFNVSFYPPQMLHHSQLRPKQQQPPTMQPPPSLQLPPCSQQGHQNPSTSSGSSSSPKNTQQSQRIPAVSSTTIASGNSFGFPHSKHQLGLHQAGQLESEVMVEDTPSTDDGRASLAQKAISSQKYAMPAHTPNFTLISPAMASLTSMTSGGSNHSERQQSQIHNKTMKMDLTQSQALAMPYASFGGAAASSSGATLQGLDFSSMAQNHALFHSLPEAARHSFQISAAAAATAHQISAAAAATAHAAQQQQQKKPEVGKTAPDLGTATTVGEEGKLSSVSHVLGSAHQHSITLSRADAEPPISSILSNSVIDSSSLNLNLIQPLSSGASRISSRPGSTATASNSSTPGLHSPNSHNLQQQQHLQQVLQLQRQHLQFQQHQQLQQQRAKPASHNNAGIYTDRLSGSSNASKFPQALAGFPPALMQSSSSSHSPQWKASPRTASTSSSAALSPSASSVKNQISLQQHVRSQLQPSHQTHISFGVSPAKVAGQTGNAVSLTSAATITVGSTHALVSKNSGSTPLSSSVAKSGPPTVLPSLPLQKQQSGKNSTSSSSTTTPLATTNRNMSSILGNPHKNSTSNSSTKPQPSSHHQPPKQHLPQAAQFFFSNPYIQNQTNPSDASVTYFQQHQQRRPSDQYPSQQREKSSSATTPGGGSAPPDPSKPAESSPASNSKGGLLPSTLQQNSHFTAAAAVSLPGAGPMHPLMPAAAAALPYMHSMQSVSLKPAPATEQKPAAGNNDNLHACWQPEKR
ncbi:protein TIME FOR COFFEE isoform X1 [Dendrobium catenatum]|nr:protein TIME FOR COFFEE isoform X1 [Dendrobium catenatum]